MNKIKEFLLFNPISELFYQKIVKPYRKYKEMLARMVFWGWKMRWSWDFEAQTIYEMLYFKLKKLEHTFENYGNCCWQTPGDSEYYRMKALKICIRICDRLVNRWDRDYAGMMKYHDEKWGEIETNIFNPAPEDYTKYGITFRSWRKNVNTEELIQQEREESDKLNEINYRMRERDKKLLFKLLNDHIDGWWD